MKQMRHGLFVIVGLVLLGLASPLLAQGDGSFDGEIIVGLREVSVDGEENKYKEDFNYQDGPRLFSLQFDFVPDEGTRELIDVVRLNVENFGGDPYETMSLSAQNYGAWSFRFNHRKSDYFYNDQLFPDEATNIRLAINGDFHHFDFERVHDSARLDIDLTRRAKIFFGFDRFTREGESTTTIDISRDEFEFERPIDESSNEWTAGLQYEWDAVTVTLQERVRDFDNSVEIFLPGFSLGETIDNNTELDFFFLNQPYDFKSYEHIVRAVATPSSRLTIRGAAMLQSLDLDAEASERSQGIDFRGNPFATNFSGGGEIERDIDQFEVDLSYLINERFAIVGGAFSRDLDQEGEFFFEGNVNEGLWQIETTGAEAGLQFAASPELTLTGGVRWETRDATWGWEQASVATPLELETEETEHTGYFATAGWRPIENLNVTLDFENSTYDDPFTLTAPTDRTRIKGAVRYAFTERFDISGSYKTTDWENDNSGWDAEDSQLDLRLGYRTDVFSASLGYGNIDMERSILQLVSAVSTPFDIFYTADSDFIDANARWTPIEWFELGGAFRSYENDGTFGLERTDLRGFAQFGFGEGYRYLARLGYRTIDYDETEFNFDDYDADILELGIGYRW